MIQNYTFDITFMKSKPLSIQRSIFVTAWALISCLLWEQALWAAGDISSIFSPKILETSTQKSWLRHAREFESPERIIHIQDAHSSLGAQKSIAGTLETLIKDYQVGLVGVEGAQGVIDTALISSFPQKNIRQAVAQSLLEQTKISGAEFHKIVSGSEVELYGLEDISLYGQNVEAYQRLLKDGELVKTELSKIFAWLEKMKARVFSGEALELGRQSRLHRDQAGSFLGYWKFLRRLAKKQGLSYAHFPQLKKIAMAMALENNIHFNQAEIERDSLMKELEDALPADAFEALVVKALEFKKGKTTPAQFYGALVDAAHGHLGRGERPNLFRYALYSRIFESVEVLSVLAELEAFEKKAYETLLKSDEERSLKKLSDAVEILSKLLEGILSSQDEKFYQDHKALFEIQTLLGALEKITSRHGVPAPSNLNLALLVLKIPQAEDFYKIVKDRNAAILSNLLKQMRAKKQKVAALVAGGFHTEGLSELMNQQRVSYLVMMPSFDEASGQRPYLTVITQKGSYLDRQVRIQAQKEAIILMLGGAVRKGMDFELAKKSFLASYRRAKEKEGYVFKKTALNLPGPAAGFSKEQSENGDFQNLATHSALNNGMTPEETLSWTRKVSYFRGFVVADELGYWIKRDRDGKLSVEYAKPLPAWMVSAEKPIRRLKARKKAELKEKPKPSRIDGGARLTKKDSNESEMDRRQFLFASVSGILSVLIGCASQSNLITDSKSSQIVSSNRSNPVSDASSQISLENLQGSGESIFSIPPPSTALTSEQRQHFLGWLKSGDSKKRFQAFVVFANAADPAAVEYAESAVTYQKDEVQSELMELLDGGSISFSGKFGGSQEQLERQLRSDGVYVENRKITKNKILEAPGWDFGVAASWVLRFLYDVGEEINIRFNEESPSVRIAAAWYLGVVADKLDSTRFQKYRVVEWLVGGLDDPDPFMRATSAWALGRYAKHRVDFFWTGNHRGAEALAKQALADPDVRARFMAISAMGLAKNAPQSQILETALVGALRKELQNDKKNLYIFAAAAKAVGNQGWVIAVPELLEALTWEFGEGALSAKRQALFKTILMDALKNIASFGNNRQAIQSLLDRVVSGDSIIASGADIEDINNHFIPVLQLLASDNASIGEIPKHTASLLLDREVRVRAQAARSLGRTGNVIAIPVLLRAIEKDPHVDVQSAAMEALLDLDLSARVYDPQKDPVIAALGKLLETSDDPLLKSQAIRVLGNRADALAAQAIAKVLDPEKEQDPQVLLKAFKAIAGLGHQGLSQVPALLNAMDRYQKNGQGVPSHRSPAYQPFDRLSRALEEALYQLSKHDKAKIVEQIQAKIRQAVSKDEQDLIDEVYAPALQTITKGSRFASLKSGRWIQKAALTILLGAAVFLSDFSFAQEADPRQNRKYKEELFDKNNLYGLEQKMNALRRLVASNTAQSLFWENPSEEERILGALKKMLSSGITTEDKKEVARFAVKFFKSNQVLEIIEIVSQDAEAASDAFDLIVKWEGPKQDALNFILNVIDVEWKYDGSLPVQTTRWKAAFEAFLKIFSRQDNSGQATTLRILEDKVSQRLAAGGYQALLDALFPVLFELVGKDQGSFDRALQKLLVRHDLIHLHKSSADSIIQLGKERPIDFYSKQMDPSSAVAKEAALEFQKIKGPQGVAVLWRRLLTASDVDLVAAIARALAGQPSFYLRLSWRLLTSEEKNKAASFLVTKNPALVEPLAEILHKIEDELALQFLIDSVSEQSPESSKDVFEKLSDSQELKGYMEKLWQEGLEIVSRSSMSGRPVDDEKLRLLENFSHLMKKLSARYPEQARDSFRRLVDRSSADERKIIAQSLLPLSQDTDPLVLERLGAVNPGLADLWSESPDNLVGALKSPDAVVRRSALEVLISKKISWKLPSYQVLAQQAAKVLDENLKNQTTGGALNLQEQVLMLAFLGDIGSLQAFETLVSFYESFLSNNPNIHQDPAQRGRAEIVLPALAKAFENFPEEFSSYFQNKLSAASLDPTIEYLAQAALKDKYGGYRRQNQIDLARVVQRWNPGLPAPSGSLGWEERRIFGQWEEFRKQELSLEEIEKELTSLEGDPRLKALQDRLEDSSDPGRFDILFDFSYKNTDERLLAMKLVTFLLSRADSSLAEDPGCLAALIKAAQRENHPDVLLYIAFALGSYQMRPGQSEDPRLEAFEALIKKGTELLKVHVILGLPTSHDPGIVKILQTLMETEDQDSYALLRAVQTAQRLSDAAVFKSLVKLLDQTGYPYFTSQSSLQTAILSALNAIIEKNPKSPTIQSVLQNQVKTWGSVSGLVLDNGSAKIRWIAIPLALKAGIAIDTGYPYWLLRILTPAVVFPTLIGLVVAAGIWRFSRNQQKKHQKAHPELDLPKDFNPNLKDLNLELEEVFLLDQEQGARLAGGLTDDFRNLVSLLNHRLEDWAKKIGTGKWLVPASEIESSIFSLFHRIYSTTLVSLEDDDFLSNDFLKERRKVIEETLCFLDYTIKYLKIQRELLKKSAASERDRKIKSHEELLAQSAQLYHYFLNYQSSLETMLAIHRLVNFSHVGAVNYWFYLYILNLQFDKGSLRSYLKTMGDLGRMIEPRSYPKKNLESIISDYVSKLREKKKQEPRSYEQSWHELREAAGLALPLLIFFGLGWGTFYSWLIPFLLHFCLYLAPVITIFLSHYFTFKPVRALVGALRKQSADFEKMYTGRLSQLIFEKKARQLFSLGLDAKRENSENPPLDFIFFMVGEKTDTDYIRRFKERVAKNPFFPKDTLPVFIPRDAYKDEKGQARHETGSLFGAYKAFRFIEYGMNKNDLIKKLLDDPDIRELNPGLQPPSPAPQKASSSLKGAVIYAGGTAEQKKFILESQDSLGRLASLASANLKSSVFSMLDMAILQAVAVGMENKSFKESFVVNVEADALFIGDPMKVTDGINLQTALAGLDQAVEEGMGTIIPDKNNHILEFIEKGNLEEMEKVFKNYQEKGQSNPSPYVAINYQNKTIPQLLVYASMWTVALKEPFLNAVHRADKFTAKTDPDITAALSSLQSALGKISAARFLLVPLTILLRKQNGIEAYRANIETKINHSSGRADKKVVDFLYDLFQRKYLKAVRDGDRSLVSFKVDSAGKHDFFSKGSLKNLESLLLGAQREDESSASLDKIKAILAEWDLRAQLRKTAAVLKDRAVWFWKWLGETILKWQTQWAFYFDRHADLEKKELLKIARERKIAVSEDDSPSVIRQKIRGAINEKTRAKISEICSRHDQVKVKIKDVFNQKITDAERQSKKELSLAIERMRESARHEKENLLSKARFLKGRKEKELNSRIQSLREGRKEALARIDQRYKKYFIQLNEEFKRQIKKEQADLSSFDQKVAGLRNRKDLSRLEKRALESFEKASKQAANQIELLRKQYPLDYQALKSRFHDERVKMAESFKQKMKTVWQESQNRQVRQEENLRNQLEALEETLQNQIDSKEIEQELNLSVTEDKLAASHSEQLEAAKKEANRLLSSIQSKRSQEIQTIESVVAQNVKKALEETFWRRLLKAGDPIIKNASSWIATRQAQKLFDQEEIKKVEPSEEPVSRLADYMEVALQTVFNDGGHREFGYRALREIPTFSQNGLPKMDDDQFGKALGLLIRNQTLIYHGDRKIYEFIPTIPSEDESVLVRGARLAHYNEIGDMILVALRFLDNQGLGGRAMTYDEALSSLGYSSRPHIKYVTREKLEEGIRWLAQENFVVLDGEKIYLNNSKLILDQPVGARLAIVISKKAQTPIQLHQKLSTVRELQERYPKAALTARLAASFQNLPKPHHAERVLFVDPSTTPAGLAAEIRKIAEDLYRESGAFPEMEPYDLAMLKSLKPFYEERDYTLSGLEVSKVSKQDQYVVVTDSVLKNEVIPFGLQRKMLLSQTGLKAHQLKVALVTSGQDSDEELQKKGIDLVVRAPQSRGGSQASDIYSLVRDVLRDRGLGVARPDQVRMISRGEWRFGLDGIDKRELLLMEVQGQTPSSWILIEAFKHHERGRKIVIIPKKVDWDKVREAIERVRLTQTFA
jgi:HEAT repeat protein